MVEEGHMSLAERGPRKRKSSRKKGSKAKKKLKVPPDSGEKVKINQKMRKLFRRRAREYNSDGEEEEEELARETADDISLPAKDTEGLEVGDFSDAEGEDRDLDSEKENFSGDEENSEIQPGIANFTKGLRAFKMAFRSVLKSSVADDALGPVLSAQRKLVAEKLAEEEAEWKVKGEAKKEKHMAGEKGHVKPANYLDSHEKFLIGVATKGVVKLFNAVNKAQNAQKGLNPSRSKDAKVLKKRRKETFFSELGKTPILATDSSKGHSSSGAADGEDPAWAPLRDNYMLTNSKLKDWDKIPESNTVADDIGRMSEDEGSSDDECD